LNLNSIFANLSRSMTATVTIAVATVIVFAGVAYALVRPVSYESQASIVLDPAPTDPNDLAGVLDSFQRSGVSGTMVELLASEDTLKQAGNPPVTVKVRAVPDTRVIRISAEAQDENVVQPALRALLTAANREQEKLTDVWDLQILQTPSAPSRSSTSTGLILIATLLLALLGALCAWTLMRRYGGSGPDRRGPDGTRAEALTAAGWLTREGPRYPTSR
jgi:uncharacterized protein involved in exopolysaccharide biosynthesis